MTVSTLPFSSSSRALASLAVALLATVSAARAQSIPIPNHSFETPETGFVNTNIGSWLKSPQPVWFDPDLFGGQWDQAAGVYANTAVGESDHHPNMHGDQASFIFALPELALFQDLATSFAVGTTYTLSAGFIGTGGNMLSGVTFDLQLYYRDALNAITPIVSTTVVSNATNFPNRTNFVYSSAVLAAVQAGDAWAGKPIGVRLLSTANFGNLGGYWDVDNVTLVPEPTSAGLLALGGALLLQRRRSRGGLWQ